MRYGLGRSEWQCEVCGEVNHVRDGECQFCECGGLECERANCSGEFHCGLQTLGFALQDAALEGVRALVDGLRGEDDDIKF
jgi:hypothetical protein